MDVPKCSTHSELTGLNYIRKDQTECLIVFNYEYCCYCFVTESETDKVAHSFFANANSLTENPCKGNKVINLHNKSFQSPIHNESLV